MAVICITGSVSSQLQTVENILLQAGMQAPRPLPKEEPIDIRQWQRHVLASVDGESSGAIKDPGRLWELLAGEIVLANLKAPLWGWCDPASLRFLDFWLGFAPEFKFLLVCQTPQQLLAERLENADVPLNVAELLELWQAQHQEMLRFHHRNPERSILIYAADAVASPDRLVAACSKRWKLPLAATGIDVPSSPELLDALANFFAYRMAALQPEIDALNREILATATILAPVPVEELTTEPQLEELLADYLDLRCRLSAGEQEQTKLATKNAGLQNELTAVREQDEQSRLAAELKLQQENELLLLQLHQVQEELEVVFVKEQEAKGRIEQLTKERTEQSKLATERQKTIDKLGKERDEQSKLATERQKAIDKLGKERDEQSRLATERQKTIDKLGKEHDALNKSLAEQKSRAEQLTKTSVESPKLAAELKEQQQENELLLLQLHQVQEELEHYFLQHQQIQKEYSGVKTTLQRLLQRDPCFYDYEALKISAAPGESSVPAINCRLTNLTAAGRNLPAVEFTVVIEQGVAGFIVPSGADAFFVRPPVAAPGETAAVLIPVGSSDNLQHRLDRLASLSSSDWTLLTTLTRLLKEALSRPEQLQWSSPLDHNLFLSGLTELDNQLQQQQNRVRYDAVSLKREQVNPDYEHLWFRLDNVALQGQLWPNFEFRLSCAHVRPDSFGAFPKLEFPADSGQGPFQGWFVESSDDFGDKMELRFSVPDASMDQEVWRRLAAEDRHLITALLTDLPRFLAALQQSGEKIQRPYADWTKMVSQMQRIATQGEGVPITEVKEPNLVLPAGAGTAALHYAGATLKREQVNPDYEHLWIRFDSLSFQGGSWPAFEFRLSCAHVRPDSFGGFPKLEFPAEGSQAPFEGWFIEANDDFGDKLELRFSLPDQALDLGVWERVTEHDRAFMTALVAELPQILLSLQQSGVQIKRPWEDWTKMAAEMMPIVSKPAKQKGKKKSSLKKMLRRLKI